jgi:CubicO group peptidase (beta-lactamase class C family)
MTANLRDKHVAGATVAVVKDGALFFAKGYGYADVEQRKPVDPERTLFRLGSTSKLFTWTAVMQLVEDGKLDLDADVNRYLDFKIPATYPEPITLRHIMTHTAGFEEDLRDLIAKDSAHMVPLGRWLETHMPERVRPPGNYASYSNYATALAGYVVERVSGLSWDDYIERRILGPLGMNRTTGRQPLPPQFREDMSHGYSFSRGQFEPKEWEIIMGAAPAGSISASATDMATFMLAHLGNGAVETGGFCARRPRPRCTPALSGTTPGSRASRWGSTRNRATGSGSSAMAATRSGFTPIWRSSRRTRSASSSRTTRTRATS